MRKAFSSALFTVIAIAMFAVMFGGVVAADTTHGKAPPGQSIVLTDNDYPVTICGTSFAGIVGRASCATDPAGAITSIVGATTAMQGATDFHNYVCAVANNEVNLALMAAPAISEAWRSSCGVGKVTSGDFARAYPLRTRTVSPGDDVGDRT